MATGRTGTQIYLEDANGSFGSDVPSSWCTPSRRPMTEYHPSEIIEEDSQAIPIEDDSVFVPQKEEVYVEV